LIVYKTLGDSPWAIQFEKMPLLVPLVLRGIAEACLVFILYFD